MLYCDHDNRMIRRGFSVSVTMTNDAEPTTCDIEPTNQPSGLIVICAHTS
jgi:hypothetical protein